MKNFTNYIKEDDDKKIEKFKGVMASVLKKNKVKYDEILVWDYGPTQGMEFLITMKNGSTVSYTPKDNTVKIPKDANPNMKKMRAHLATLTTPETPNGQKIADVKLGKYYKIAGLENALKML